MTDKERDDVMADLSKRVSAVEKEIKDIKDALNVNKEMTAKPPSGGTIDCGSFWKET